MTPTFQEGEESLRGTEQRAPGRCPPAVAVMMPSLCLSSYHAHMDSILAAGLWGVPSRALWVQGGVPCVCAHGCVCASVFPRLGVYECVYDTTLGEESPSGCTCWQGGGSLHRRTGHVHSGLGVCYSLLA